MNIAFTTVTFRKKSIEQIVAIAVKSNIKSIEWGGDVHLPYDDILTAKKIKRYTDKLGIQNISYGSYYCLGDRDMVKFEKLCQVADIIGAKTIRVWLGCTASKDTTSSNFALYVEDARSICDIAIRYNLTVASEFHNGTYNDSAASALHFIKAVNKPNLKTYWQPLGVETEDCHNLKTILPYLSNIHVFNWDKNGRRKLLSKNTEKWLNYLLIAKNATKGINLIIEFVKKDSRRVFSKDVKTLQAIKKESEVV